MDWIFDLLFEAFSWFFRRWTGWLGLVGALLGWVIYYFAGRDLKVGLVGLGLFVVLLAVGVVIDTRFSGKQ